MKRVLRACVRFANEVWPLHFNHTADVTTACTSFYNSLYHYGKRARGVLGGPRFTGVHGHAHSPQGLFVKPVGLTSAIICPSCFVMQTAGCAGMRPLRFLP